MFVFGIVNSRYGERINVFRHPAIYSEQCTTNGKKYYSYWESLNVLPGSLKVLNKPRKLIHDAHTFSYNNLFFEPKFNNFLII